METIWLEAMRPETKVIINNDTVCAGCRGGGEVVHCNAAYGHDYPFGPGDHGRPER